MDFERRQVAERTLKMALHLGRLLGESRLIDDPDILRTVAGDESVCEGVVPDLLIRARTEADVVEVMKAAAAFSVPITPRAGGTGKAGGAIPLFGGAVLDTTRLDRLIDVDAANLTAVVQPGMVLARFQETIAGEGLFYPPDPNSLETCCLGGNVAHNAGGPRAFKYGVTRNYVMGGAAVLMGGERLAFGRQTVKCAAGYDLTGLMVGSEGTLGLFTELRLSLIRTPRFVTTALVLFPDEVSAGRAVAAVVADGLRPRVMELLDQELTRIVRRHGITMIPEGTGAVLLIELDGDEEAVVEAELERLADVCDDQRALDVLLAKHGGDREKLWSARRELSEALKGEARFKVSEDIAVPRSAGPVLLERLRALSRAHEVRIAAYGHAGDGNYHVNFLYDDENFDPEPAIVGLLETALELGGTITGEHGVGLAKKAYLPLEKSPGQIAWMRAQKELFDPAGLLNPGKIF